MLKQTLHQTITAIKSKKISSYDLVSWYCQKIKAVNPHINAVVQFDEALALQKAQDADVLLSQNKYQGILHGIPFTAKDWFETKDFISAAGMQERISFVPKSDAIVVARLVNAGGILVGKTNVPLTGLETENPVYGRTANPYNLQYSPGASSGGEAAIIAAGGTAFGIGSDSGGSIRIPSHYCGIAGLKPTTGRIPATGHFPAIGNFIDPRSQIGPMARYVDDLEIIYFLLRGNDGIDPYVLDVPDYPSAALENLHIAYYFNHEDIIPTEDVQKVMQECIALLKTKVASIQNQSPNLADVMNITYRYWDLYKNPPQTSEYLKLLEDWDKFRFAMWSFIQPFDAIITPVSEDTAKPFYATKSETFCYTLTYSLVGWPSVVVRVGTSSKGLPINVQVIAKPFQEMTCLLIAKTLEKMCGYLAPSWV